MPPPAAGEVSGAAQGPRARTGMRTSIEACTVIDSAQNNLDPDRSQESEDAPWPLLGGWRSTITIWIMIAPFSIFFAGAHSVWNREPSHRDT
jgi:hypothetical protein